MSMMRTLLTWTTSEGRAQAESWRALLNDVSPVSWEFVAQEQTAQRTTMTRGDAFTAMVEAHHVRERVAANEIDEVWTTDNGDEWYIYWDASRPFVAMNIHPSALANCAHHFGHRVEESISRQFGIWNTRYQAQLGPGTLPKIVNDWDRFTAVASMAPGMVGGCGNCHCAPNGLWDDMKSGGAGWSYDHDNTWAGAWSSWRAWASYPDLTAPLERIGRDAWGMVQSDWELGYLLWWLRQVPRNVGTHQDAGQQVENNWWKYIAFAATDGAAPPPVATTPWIGWPKLPVPGSGDWMKAFAWVSRYGMNAALYPAPWTGTKVRWWYQ